MYERKSFTFSIGGPPGFLRRCRVWEAWKRTRTRIRKHHSKCIGITYSDRRSNTCCDCYTDANPFTYFRSDSCTDRRACAKRRYICLDFLQRL